MVSDILRSTVSPAVADIGSIHLPWVPSADRLLLTHLGGIRRSAERTDTYEIQCYFVDEAQSWVVPMHSWAPLEQLSLLRPGAVFEHHMPAGRRDLAARRLASLRPESMCQVNQASNGRYMGIRKRSVGTPPLRGSQLLRPWYYLGHDQGRLYYLPVAEVFRFYLGSLSRVAGGLMALGDEPGFGLVDPEQTRFLDSDTLQIAPLAGLGDRSSALYLALLMQSPDLLAFWRTTVDMFRASNARGEPDFFPEMELPALPHPLAVLGRGESIQHDFAYDERAFLVWSMTSDYRPAPFRRLVIKLPDGMDEIDLQTLSEEPEDLVLRQQNVLASNPRWERQRRPGASLGAAVPFHESLRRTFPGLSRVNVAYDERPKIPRKPILAIEHSERQVHAISTLPAGRDRAIGGLSLRPGRIHAMPAATTAPSKLLFADQDFELGHFRPERITSDHYPISTFISAFKFLARHRAGGLVGQSPMSALSGEAMVLVPAATWGPAARGRIVAVGRIDLDDGPVYAFELSRKLKSERISLGVLARADGRSMSWRDISAVARHAIIQLSLRGSGDTEKSRGVWPSPREFADIRGRIARHTRRRQVPSWLAEDLDGLARSLHGAEAWGSPSVDAMHG